MTAADAIPVFRAGIRLQRDEARGSWTLLGPERLFQLDDTASDVLQLVDGQRTIGAIVDVLAKQYDAPRTEIEADVHALLSDLVSRGALRL